MADKEGRRGSKQVPYVISAASNVDLSHPLMRGVLYKKSHIIDSFNKRYFVLYKECLVYYHNEDEFEKDVSHGNLKHRQGCIVLNRLYLTKPDKKPHGGKYCFVLHTPDPANKRKEILLVSHTREERRDWMIALQKLNPNLVSPDVIIHPDSPMPSRKTEPLAITPSEDDMSSLDVPFSSSRKLSFDAIALNVIEEGHSDHEDHEPEDNETCPISFTVPSLQS